MKSFSLLNVTLLLLLSVCPAKSVAAQSAVTVINNGPAANRVDLAIIGEGYQAGEQARFAADVEKVAQRFFTEEPFREYRQYFNVHRIDVASNNSGADHPEFNPPVMKDTAFDATYNCDGIDRLICVNNAKVLNTVSGVLAPAERDIILVLVNDETYGGSGGQVAVASRNQQVIELVLHELGHSFGGLADEYGGPPPPFCDASREPFAANSTRQTQRALIKWAAWIDPATKLPTTAPLFGVPGLYEGASYCDTGVYRPTFSSRMRILGLPYEQINSEQLIRRIYNLVSPIDESLPADDYLSLARGETKSFSATTPKPLTLPLTVTWFVDGEVRATGTNFTLDSAMFAAGPHTVEVVVIDSTQFVRSDPAELLVERRNWQVTVIDHAARAVRAATVIASPNTTASLPIELTAQGDERGLSFSLAFDPAVLGNPRAEIGADAGGAALTTNVAEAAMGRFGVTLTLPAGERFSPGSRQIAVVSFSVAAGTGAASAMVGFENQPVRQQAFDLNDAALSATWVPGLVAINARTVASVSAATFKGAALARELIAVAFGAELTGSTESATTLPLPTSLGGVTVRVKDSVSVERAAPLFFVSPGQINYLIPEGTANGTATVTVTGSNYTAVGVIEIAPTAPGIFAANSDGRGVPAASALRIKADGSQSYESAFVFNGLNFVARPLNLGPESEQLILVLFGTGLRHYNSRAAVTVNIGGIDAEVLYVGPQGGFIGLDQVNVRIPRRLIGRGDVDVRLMVDGQSANVMKVNVF